MPPPTVCALTRAPRHQTAPIFFAAVPTPRVHRRPQPGSPRSWLERARIIADRASAAARTVAPAPAPAERAAAAVAPVAPVAAAATMAASSSAVAGESKSDDVVHDEPPAPRIVGGLNMVEAEGS